MRFKDHPVRHWILVTVVALVALFTFNHAWGQSAGAAAVFAGERSPTGVGGIDTSSTVAN